MLTPAILAITPDLVVRESAQVCVIWRRDRSGCWDYVCRAPDFDVERIIWQHTFELGTQREDYKVTQG